MEKYKNILLLSMLFISKIRTLFYGIDIRVQWWFFNVDELQSGIRIDWMVYFYSIAVNFLIISYCLLKPKGVYTLVKEFIFIVVLMDLIHLMMCAGKGFALLKIMLCIIILVLRMFYKKYKWQDQNIF